MGLNGYISKEFAVVGHTTIQPESVADGAKLPVSIFPSITFLTGVGLLFFYTIDKKMEIKIEAELKARTAENTNLCQ